MSGKKVFFGIVSLVMLLSSAVQVLAGDGNPIFDYKGSVKYYDYPQQKIASDIYQGYLIVDTNDVVTAVWYGISGVNKIYWLEPDAPVSIGLLDTKGNAFFSYGSSDFGFGKATLSKTDQSLVSYSASGTIADVDNSETGTFSVKYNSVLTKKAITLGVNALDQVIADLKAKKYVEEQK